MVHSRAKLAYETVTAAELPDGFGELSSRVAAAEDARGASRVDFPEQSVEEGPDGGMRLVFEARASSQGRGMPDSVPVILAEVKDGRRVPVPLLYTGRAPEIVNDTTARAWLSDGCAPGDAYLVDLRTGRPVPDR